MVYLVLQELEESLTKDLASAHSKCHQEGQEVTQPDKDCWISSWTPELGKTPAGGHQLSANKPTPPAQQQESVSKGFWQFGDISTQEQELLCHMALYSQTQPPQST